MKLQKASRFALYAVLELAAHPERQLSASEIAEKYGISTNHLAKVLRDLGRAGLVDSARGAGGGYRFCGNAKRVTLLDIIALFEDLGPGDPVAGDPAEKTDVGRGLRMVLSEIDDIARATLRSITLATLLKLMTREPRPAREETKTEATVRA
jgi:Rrf2 family transcriptional regulator, nitric oxide-sensitive transcriptional repressor